MMRKFKRSGCNDDDYSWQVRVQEDAAANMFGCTWPPCSYTCAFCRREFRSAQALGGHMNVHRRDRARLHELLPIPEAREFAAANGMRNLNNLYNLPNPRSILSPNPHMTSFSSLLPITTSSLVPDPQLDLPSFFPIPTGLHRSYTDPSHFEEAFDSHHGCYTIDHRYPPFGKVDLELRLGQRRSPPPL